jgi:hypothetical protein
MKEPKEESRKSPNVSMSTNFPQKTAVNKTHDKLGDSSDDSLSFSPLIIPRKTTPKLPKFSLPTHQVKSAQTIPPPPHETKVASDTDDLKFLYKQKRYAEVKAKCLQMLKTNPKNPKATLLLANSLMFLGCPIKAQKVN